MIPVALRLIGVKLCLGAFFAGTVAAATTNSDWLIRTWQTEDGLPQNRVNDIVQGQDGYLWLATAVGLAKFDGVRFTRFAYRNEDEGRDQSVRRIMRSVDNGLWIVPMQGAPVHLSADSSQVQPLNTGLPGSPTGLYVAEDGDGTLWMARTSKAIVQIKNGKAMELDERAGIPTNGAVMCLIRDGAGSIWLAKGHTVGVFRGGKFEPVANFKFNAHLAADRTNGIWIAAGAELFKWDREAGLRDLGTLPVDDPHTAPVALMEDHAGAVWIGTDTSGLFRYNEDGFERVEISYPAILSLAEDRENNIWVGTDGGGLNRISPRRVELEGLGNGSSAVAIQSICQDTDGTLWGATQNGLLVCRRDGNWTTALTNTLEAVLCVAAARDGGVWIGARNKTLYCWRNHTLTTWGDAKGIVSVNVSALLSASTGDLWIGENSPDTVQCLHDGILRVLALPKRIGGIRAMAEDTSGNIWIGTGTGNLLRAEGDHLVDETPRTGVEDRPIWSLCATPDSALWIGYVGWGLGRIKGGQFTHLDAGQGLPKDYISQIVADDVGWLWFGTTDHGIFKIRQEELNQALADGAARVRPVFYGRNEGLSSMEVVSASPGAIRSRDGRLWFALRKSLAVVDPKIRLVNPEPPPVLLSQVTVDGQTIASGGGVAQTQAVINLNRLDAPLQLPPTHRRLEFGFTAINLSAPENIHFRYRLEGLDDNWVDAEAGSAKYSRLTAGNYRLRVEASNGNGPWNDTPTTLALTVLPFFWQTWWFRIGGLVLFTSAVIAAVRYVSFRRLHVKLRELEQQVVLDKERTRIARDLHDDLGCSLTHVALMLEMKEQGLESSARPGGNGQSYSSMVRQVVKSVDEIIWAISPRNDQLQYLSDYIVEFAVGFLHSAGIHPHVDLPERISGRTVSPEVRHNLFLVVKEALNNVVRHAKADEVRFRISTTGDQLGIFIEDNGLGFKDLPDNASADGLRNMRHRMEEIGGRFQIESRPGGGTRVSLTYFWPNGH